MLAVRIEVDDILGAALIGEGHAGLQRRPLAEIDRMPQREDGQLLQNLPSVVAGAVIHDHDGIAGGNQRRQGVGKHLALVVGWNNDVGVAMVVAHARSLRQIKRTVSNKLTGTPKLESVRGNGNGMWKRRKSW